MPAVFAGTPCRDANRDDETGAGRAKGAHEVALDTSGDDGKGSDRIGKCGGRPVRVVCPGLLRT
jgi:hypothetical protein